MAEEIDPVAFVSSTVSPMAKHTFPWVCSIVGIEGEDAGQHVGTGFRVATDSRRWLVTANHVIEQARAFPMGAGFVMSRGRPPVALTGAAAVSDAEHDLAAIELGGSFDPSAFFSLSAVDVDERARSHDFLFVHGFPGERARFLFGESHHRSLPYGVMERDDDLPKDIGPFEFAMDYDPGNMRLESGTDASMVLPAGLSGSPVWRIGAYHRHPDSWRPDACRLVGVVTRWDQDKRVLLATGVQQLCALIGE